MTLWTEGHSRFVQQLRSTLASTHKGLEALEVSVRGGTQRPVSGRRVMLERLDRRQARIVLEEVGHDIAHPSVVAMLDAAQRMELPLIAGWDAVTASRVIAKLYVNASDASRSRRCQLARELQMQGTDAAPHVIGLNMHPDRSVQTKAYYQSAAVPDGAPAILRHWATKIQVGGVVRSEVVRPGVAPQPKAWFLAPLRPADPETFEVLKQLPGWSRAAWARELPFPPGHITSFGWRAGVEIPEWTVYVKPRVASVATWSLEPACSVATSECEVGLYLEPLETERAYYRGRHHALSYRVRAGAPGPEAIETIMSWAVARLELHERTGAPMAFDSPPEPWHVISST